MRIATLAEALGSDDKVPTEFRIFAAGQTKTKKGIFTFDAEAAESVKKHASEWGNDYSIDYDHAAFSLFGGGPAIAAAWFRPEVRQGELWATEVEWTDKARAHLEAREYRYFSPTFRHEEDGRILELLNIALTNVPATKGMQPLMASDDGSPAPEEKNPMWKTLLKMLGLSENASEAEAIAALNTERGTRSEELRQFLSATGKANGHDAIAVLNAWKVAAEQSASLSQQLATLQAKEKGRETQSLLDQAKRDGKLTPAMEEKMKPMLLSMDAAQLQVFFDAMPKQLPTPHQEPSQGAPNVAGLSATEREVCRQTGMSFDEFAKAKAAKLGTAAQ